MANPALLLSGIGMALVGIVAIAYWKFKFRVSINYFLWGAAAWVIAIAIKMVMDYTITPFLNVWLQSFGIVAALVGMGIYVGLRTGILESGTSYIIMIKTRLRKMDFKKGVAFGIGFGAAEAIFLGVTSFLNILVFVMFPDIIGIVPEPMREVLLTQLNASSWIVIAPVIERISITFIHIFSALLVLYALKSRKLSYLVYSILFKTFVDGIIPWLAYNMQPLYEVVNAYMIQIPFIILAIISYFGIKWLKPKLGGDAGERIMGKVMGIIK